MINQSEGLVLDTLKRRLINNYILWVPTVRAQIGGEQGPEYKELGP